MTWRIPLRKGRHATLICTYAPTLVAEDATKDHFYESLDQALHRLPPSDKVVGYCSATSMPGLAQTPNFGEIFLASTALEKQIIICYRPATGPERMLDYRLMK